MQSFAELSEELKEILMMAHHKRKIIKGTFLFQEGMNANELFIVESGLIQVSKIVPDGRELTLRMCSKGDLIGELSLFCLSPKYMMNAKVMESGEVSVIFQDELEEKLEQNHQLALELMKWISLQYRKTQTKFRDLVLHGKKGALYSTLIRLANSYGELSKEGIIIKVPLTNQELANFCGTSREVVNRMLGELRKIGVLSIDKGIITIHKLSYLKTEIDCENCPLDICNIE
ncbi:Crp/Fnr family transcriptional regulator [Bacillus sp. FJAT-49705]|uniref:Crp/Fnr family transcriptional regulator n=1 Tax=Cytobacillus citreus TaxID=2833586 RepID=A0ABS5NPJ4_9BACI|nr:Crp/Fnr family transcriptional regulator [Cytobacillus citreus]